MSNFKSNNSANTTGANIFKKRKGTFDPNAQNIDLGENNGSVLLIQNNTNYYIGNSVLEKNPIMMKNAFSSKQARHQIVSAAREHAAAVLPLSVQESTLNPDGQKMIKIPRNSTTTPLDRPLLADRSYIAKMNRGPNFKP